MKNLQELEESLDKVLLEKFDTVIAVREELSKETDRGCALMAASFLDYEIESLLRSKLVGNKKHLDSLFDFNGPLGSFSARIKMAYSIGLISKEIMADLDIIRKIRNEFGHKYEPISFESRLINSQIANLKHTFHNAAEVKPRTVFNNTVTLILAFIHASLHQENTIKEKEYTTHPKQIMQMAGELTKVYSEYLAEKFKKH
jgi:DNA-binding MltR family transcriptional regulator